MNRIEIVYFTEMMVQPNWKQGNRLKCEMKMVGADDQQQCKAVENTAAFGVETNMIEFISRMVCFGRLLWDMSASIVYHNGNSNNTHWVPVNKVSVIIQIREKY